MKATELLQRQHREIEQHLDRLRNAGPEEQATIREELASLLVAHAVIEQEHFYPAVRRAAPNLVLEALEEHGLVSLELGRNVTTRLGDESMSAKAVVLAEVFTAHMRKEENEIFRHAERNLTNEELSDLTDIMDSRFQQVRQMGYRRFLAQAIAVTMPRLAIRAHAQRGAKRARTRVHAKEQAPARRAASSRQRATQKSRATSKAKAQGTRKAAQSTRQATRKGGKTARRSATQSRRSAAH